MEEFESLSHVTSVSKMDLARHGQKRLHPQLLSLSPMETVCNSRRDESPCHVPPP